MTTASGEGLVKSFGNKSSTVVAKDLGKKLAKMEIRSFGVTLIPSKDFVDDDHSYDILLSTWYEDIMWWNPANTHITTDIGSFEIWHSTCKERVDEFNEPMDIYFALKDNSKFHPKTFSDTFEVPNNYHVMSEEKLNYQIKVYRVILPKTVMLHVKFFNISLENAFKVAITKFEFPTFKSFEKSSTISSENDSSASFVNTDDDDIFLYIAVMVDKNFTQEAQEINITYSLSFYVTTCVEWLQATSQWEPSCKPRFKSNTSVINCGCTHFSVLAGYIDNIEFVPQHPFPSNIELVLQGSLTIFVTVAVTLCFYCLLILIILFAKRQEVFYLSDNNYQDRFAYLLVVNTGMSYNSGTSSNVVVKLVGEKKSSQPHILNYPDPEQRLLQSRGSDMFFLTTDSHLGNLQQLEIWIDGIGFNPDWYCKEIIVYDMQELTVWYFDVRKRLSVIKDTTFVTVSNNPEKGHLAKKLLADFKSSQKYHTWFLCMNEIHFSYLKKLTVLLSNFLTIYLFAMFFHGLPTLQIQDCLERYEDYRLDSNIVLVAFASSFLSFLLHFGIATCFRFSQLQFMKYPDETKWSFKFTLICWSVVISIICISTTFLVVYGFWVPYITSLIWLTSCVIAMAFSACIYEIIFVFVQTFVFNFEPVYNLERKSEDLWKLLQKQKETLYSKFSVVFLRPYFAHLYTPLTPKQIQGKQVALNRRYFVIHELSDLVMFGIYVIILYVVVLADRPGLTVYEKEALSRILAGEHFSNFSFKKIETFRHVYRYINKTLIPATQPRYWYGNYSISDPGMMIDVVNKYVGVVRLRQHRMADHSCEVVEKMRFLNVSCWPEFSLRFEETGTFGYTWGEYTYHMESDRLRSIWQYSSETETKTFGIVGEFGIYSGGGYVLYLGRTLFNSYANFRKIFEKNWIDLSTRVIFIEFLTYNANYNVFNSIELRFELSTTGYTYKSLFINTSRMLFVQNEVERISVVFFFMFAVWVGILFCKQTIGTFKRLKSFYKDVWFMIDFVILLMSLACIILFVVRMNMIGQYLEEMEEVKHNEFISYFHLFYIEDFLTTVAAFLICVATIRLWKFLRFGMMFRVLEKTLAIASVPLLSFTIISITVLLAFAFPVMMMTGNNFQETHSMGELIRRMVTISLKSRDLSLKQFSSRKFAMICLIFYEMTLQLIMFMYIMIVVMSYFEAQLAFSVDVEQYNIKHYVQRRFRYIRKFIKYKFSRLKGGVKVVTKVKPKSDKFLYLNSVILPIFRLRMMKKVTKCIIRNIRYSSRKPRTLSKRDVKLMANVCRELLIKDFKGHHLEVFYKGLIQGKRVEFVHKHRVEQAAKVTNFLLKGLQLSAKPRPKRPNYERCIKIVKKGQTILRKCCLRLKQVVQNMEDADLVITENDVKNAKQYEFYLKENIPYPRQAVELEESSEDTEED